MSKYTQFENPQLWNIEISVNYNNSTEEESIEWMNLKNEEEARERKYVVQ